MLKCLDDSHARPRGWAFLAVAAALCVASGWIFLDMHRAEPIMPGPGVSQQKMLSDWAPGLAGTAADTPVYILEGAEPGGTALLLGGTHPQEVAGMLAAVLTIENVQPQKGRLIVIPQSNRSGFTHTDPMEGFPHRFEIDTPHGPRWFRLGMRLANPIDQWPDPDLHHHPQSGEGMVGSETRNLNRNYPGDAQGRFTARIAAAIVDLVKAEGVDITLDMHEAYPEYPIIDMLVAHQRAFEVATITMIDLQMRGIDIDLMASPVALRGLSHRELGDHTDTLAILNETANAAMGRFRGRTDETLVVEGRDDNYVRAAGLKRLFVPFDEEGHPLSVRTARQIAVIEEMLIAYNEQAAEEGRIELADVPAYEDILADGLGNYLLPVVQ